MDKSCYAYMTEEKRWEDIAPTFTAAEVARTGADPASVTISLMRSLKVFRLAIGHPVMFQHNGLTTGEHSSSAHAKGVAADVYTAASVDARALFDAAIMAGFRAVGLYWNGNMYSAHLELISYDELPRYWTGYKAVPGEGVWLYGPLINDPKMKMMPTTT